MPMSSLRSLVLLATIATTVAIGAGAAPALAAAAKSPIPNANCGSLRAGGITWWIGTTKISCAEAKLVVTRLAPLPVPKGAYPQVKRGFNCVAFERPGAKKSLGRITIGCLSPTTGAILAAADARW